MSDFNIQKVAKLARLELDDNQAKQLSSSLSGILGFVDELKEVDVEGVEPTSHPLKLENVFREDVPVPSKAGEQILKHAPSSHKNFFQVPKVIEGK